MELDDFSFMGRDLTEVERDHMKILQQITPELFSEFLTEKTQNNSAFPAAAYSYLYLIPQSTRSTPIHQSILMPMTGVMLRQTTRIMRQLVFMMRAMK